MAATDTRILLADDERMVRETLVDYLAPLCANIRTCATGLETLDHLRDHDHTADPYDLMILDVRMPWTEGHKPDNACGLTLLREQQRSSLLIGHDTPAIVYTAYPSIEDCVDAMRSGAHDYIPKYEPESGESNESQPAFPI